METINYTVLYEPQVLDSLTEISLYYAEKGGQELAKTILDNIIIQLDLLAFMPCANPKTEFCADIRKKVIKAVPYIAYYTIVDAQVRILELIHSSRDQDMIYRKYKNV